MIPRVAVAVNVACFALLAWLYGGDLSDAARASSSEVAALSAMPSVAYAGAMVVLAAVGGGLTGVGVFTKRDRAWKGYRVMPIVTLVGLFVDVLIVSVDKTPFPSSQRAAVAIQLVEQRAGELASPESVPTDGAKLQEIVDELGPAPWLVKAQPVPKWTLQVEQGCAGPRLDRGSAGAGTLIYCVSADRSQAWITAVGLPREERFGAPQLVSSDGQPLVGVVQKRVADEAPVPPPEELPAEELPMYFDTDAGNL